MSTETPSQASTTVKHTAPLGPIEHGFTAMPYERPFSRFGILLPILMLAIVPSLLLMYVARVIGSRALFTGASILTLVVIIGSSVIIIVSGIMGAIEYMQYRKLHPHRKHQHD